jgi:hypothetical protein
MTVADPRFFVGATFGRLTLRQRARESSSVHPNLRKRWICDCECGIRVTVPQAYMMRKVPKLDCGKCEDRKTLKTKFNSEYRIWLMMQVRCNDPRHKSYKDYGGRGIKVCDEWSDPVTGFSSFLAHIGPRPSPRHSVDRYPVDPNKLGNAGGYEPGNVRWATSEQQVANQRPRKPREVT